MEIVNLLVSLAREMNWRQEVDGGGETLQWGDCNIDQTDKQQNSQFVRIGFGAALQ